MPLFRRLPLLLVLLLALPSPTQAERPRPAKAQKRWKSKGAKSRQARIAATAERAAAKILTTLPVDTVISSTFGIRRDPIRRRRHKLHKGLDFAAVRGTPVLAAGGGLVASARRRGGYGKLVVIDHGNGLETRYAHLRSFRVKKGERIQAGAMVGRVGSTGRSTGPHLHFEVRLKGRAVPPSQFVGFKLPACAAKARHCRPRVRKRRRLPNS